MELWGASEVEEHHRAGAVEEYCGARVAEASGGTGRGL